MKKLAVFTILLVFLATGYVFSQNMRERPQRPPIPDSKQIEQMVTDLSAELSLTTEESEKLIELFEEHFDEVKEKTENGAPNRDEMEALKSKFETKVKELLGSEKFEKFQNFMRAHSPKRRD
ncbi:hypothetical protein DSN97_01990 [Deferribacteraceae bacterium V6Fe1]|nr:hypothetical protein DSN97_01990 [Deferribacteraceae bacterium V6Fe1]